LVDTTVIVDLLKGIENEKVKLFEEILSQNAPYGISSHTYQEVLQGARNDHEYSKLKKYLSSQKVYFLTEEVETYEKAAHIFYQLRRQGITIRSAIDILIALTAIEYNLYLLHNDRDFEIMTGKVPGLKILNSF